MEPTYEFFDHTADIGFRLRGATLPELLKPARDALYAVIGELVSTNETRTVTFNLAGAEPAMLLRDYLAELLLLFERDARVVTSLEVSVFDEDRLAATAQAALVDRDRSVYHHEVKAITYHELAVRTIPGGYEATVIVDI